jgi:site-specific DNA-cytosine methylase
MLRSLDLFSGVGGMTLALRGIAEPVAYCDSSPEACRLPSQIPRSPDPQRHVASPEACPQRHIVCCKITCALADFPMHLFAKMCGRWIWLGYVLMEWQAMCT